LGTFIENGFSSFNKNVYMIINESEKQNTILFVEHQIM
jgi:hypothetical protein